MPNFTQITTITQGVQAAISTGTGITYNQFLNSLGSTVYKVETLYLYSSNPNQIREPFNYTIIDANGNQSTRNIIPAVDPYQNQNAIFIDLKKANIIFDSKSTLSFDLLPNTSLNTVFYTSKIGVNFEIIKNNFLQVKNSLKKGIGIFEEYETGVSASYPIIEGVPVRPEDKAKLEKYLNAEGGNTTDKFETTIRNGNKVAQLAVLGGALFLTYKLLKK